MAIEYLDFAKANCKNCYKCLRDCPVKAIRVINNQARIMDDRCILCGRCTLVCPQNAKRVHSEIDDVKKLIASHDRVIASVAPSFISSFGIRDFSVMQIALGKLGFSYAEETSIGANVVVNEYDKLLATNRYKNLISTSCPAIVRLIQLYYPKALEFVAPVDSPMIAHAKLIKKRENCPVVFIGPCIAKKREAKESGLVDGVLTFEDLKSMFEEKNIDITKIASLNFNDKKKGYNRAQFFPINRGIIKSFSSFRPNYEYLAIDGVAKCREALDNIDCLNGFFLELNACDFGCVNGPCALIEKKGAVRATSDIRKYVSSNIQSNANPINIDTSNIDFSTIYPRIKIKNTVVSEREIKEVLAKTNKFKPSDELNCGACGYATCREKAWAVINGYADVEMCLPYMRERAESMSYEIIQNSPNGILIIDEEFKIVDINNKALSLMGIKEKNLKGKDAFDYFDPTDFVIALNENKNISRERMFIDKTNSFVELSITRLKNQKVLFGIMKDITAEVDSDNKVREVTEETLKTTDEVIKKQMRVAQEIASLLGETTAETKVALLKLKKSLSEQESR